jgi:hypothetical protein
MAWTCPAKPELDLDVGARVLTIVVLCVTPDVKGVPDADVAPGKAGDVVPGLGWAEVLFGFSTLLESVFSLSAVPWWKVTHPSITCTTPLATSTSGVTTLALFTYTVPF